MDQRPAYGFSHRLRSFTKSEQITPSPLDYYAEKVNIGATSRSYSFGQRTMPITKFVTPGPGEYQPESFRRKTFPAFSFGTKSRELELVNNSSPGPGEYEIAGSFENNSRKGFSFGLRVRMK